MSSAVVTHEQFMNASRTILPRVGVGGGVREGVGFSSLNQVQIVKAVEAAVATDWTWR